MGLFGPSVHDVAPCPTVVWLALGGSPLSRRWPSLLSRWCWLVIGPVVVEGWVGDGRLPLQIDGAILIIWGAVEFYAPAPAPGVTSVFVRDRDEDRDLDARHSPHVEPQLDVAIAPTGNCERRD